MNHICKVKHDVPRLDHHHAQKHTTSKLRSASLYTLHWNIQSYRWVLHLAADFCGSMGSQTKASFT